MTRHEMMVIVLCETICTPFPQKHSAPLANIGRETVVQKELQIQYHTGAGGVG